MDLLHQLVSPLRTEISAAEKTVLPEKDYVTEKEEDSAAEGLVAEETLASVALIVVEETSGKVAVPTNIDKLDEHNSGTLRAEESSGSKNLVESKINAAAETDEKDTVAKKDMAAPRNNSSNFDVRNMRTFTKKNCKLSSLSSPSIILALLFSMVTVCNSSSCAGCEDLVGAKSGIAWDDGYGDGCVAFQTDDYCPDFGEDDEGEGAANDKW